VILADSERNPAVKSPVFRVYLLLALSLVNCDLFARTWEDGHATDSKDSLVAAISAPEAGSPQASSQFMIPGPLRSFLRMAGISQKVTGDEVLPLLSRNVFIEGYEATRPTEFLILLRRYVVQARELSDLASGNHMIIRVSNCDDAGPLLRILGYRARPSCGEPGTTLQTDDPERAFLAIDSGFPLPELEQTLQGGKPFEYPYPSSPVTVLFAESDWTKASKKNYIESSKDLLDTILIDPKVARLYWALSNLDPETGKSLQRSIGIGKLLPFAPVLDFYGRRLCISGGRVVVPGGVSVESAWKNLIGASPTNPSAFVERLLAKDKGWLAAYFDALARASGNRQAYFTDPHRLGLFYEALRSADSHVPATRGTFRPTPALLLLATRLQLENSGEPRVPGGLEVWSDILRQGHNSIFLAKSGKRTSLAGPDELVRLLFSLSRAPTDSGPLQMYMAISELDSRRSPENRLSPETVRLLASKFEDFSDQYRVFSEFPELSDESISLLLNVAQGLKSVTSSMRGNAFGIFQANVGIWQILARQEQIPRLRLNDSWQQTIKPFATIRSAAQVYDAGRASLGELFRFATGKPRPSQDELIELLAGPPQTTPDGMLIHTELAGRIRSVLDDQRLVSLDTLLTLGDALRQKAQGKQPEEYVIRLAGQTREFEMPRPIFTNGEREEWASGIYNGHHTDMQMRTDLAKVLKSSTVSHAQIDEARGQLASFLRDTLVGLNYAYYEPPGAQALHNNPVFVRSHDFTGESVSGVRTLWQAPELFGEGSPAGGGAHFVGSLADLPYALAEVEQDFISPDSVQALIWRELTPELLTSAIVPRWWDVSPIELHAVALYQRAGEELLTLSAEDEALQSSVMSVLAARLAPQRLMQIELALHSGRISEVLPQMMPADTFYLAAEFLQKYPGQRDSWGTASQELRELCEQHPEQVNWKRLSHDFGTPHPSLAQNYGLELLNIATIPPFSGYSSRFLAESWDSTNLYWARLADERGYSPVMLNRLVPELTRVMVAKIFATDFEDWPALLRAMHEAGEDFRAGKLAMPASISSVKH
jgi:hypothetical protein